MQADEVLAPMLKSAGAIVQPCIGIVSVGMERVVRKFVSWGLAGKTHFRSDIVKQVMRKAKSNEPVASIQDIQNVLLAFGYSPMGEIIDACPSVALPKAGDMVVCDGGEYALMPS